MTHYEHIEVATADTITTITINRPHARNALHGEAVAAGMVMAARLSDIDAAAADRLQQLIERAGLPIAPPPVGADKLVAAMSRDKKVQNKNLRFVLLRELGDAFVTSDYDEARLNAICEAAG